MSTNTIFIQIASYRDPELLPTLRDCLKKAKHPELLSFGICWQHAPEDSWDTLAEYASNPQFTIMDVAWNESKGACWARHNIQNMWKGEQYTLQLDSHHRFLEHWDERLITMLAQTNSLKPILTSYAGPYNPKEAQVSMQGPNAVGPNAVGPNAVGPNAVGPYNMVGKFANDIILFTPASIPDYEKLEKPIPARFVSGHYYFTYGVHCQECKYDPELYFTGEEISLSVRSFTLGYDLFHPHRTIIWHEYSRAGRTKHWDDFASKNKEAGHIKQVWTDLDVKSKNRVRVLLKQLTDPKIDLGEYVLGTVRTLEEYELYAGINFKLNLLHPDALVGKNPPTNDYHYNWTQANTEYSFTLKIPPLDNLPDLHFICICLEDENNTNLYRKDLTTYMPTLNIKIKSHLKPTKWIYWPNSKTTGWGKKIVFPL
jgi:hypothetical protein